ncbi:MAG: hypothetical protein ACRBM6_08185 [Geminicoccales bacterium]
MLKSFFRAAMFGALTCLVMPNPAVANDYEQQLREVFEQRLKHWLEDKDLVEAIRLQNAEHDTLDAARIDALDSDWRQQAKAGGGPLIDRIKKKKASSFLFNQKQKSDDLVTEVFVMDNKGLNVAISDVTSDYMQGDEAKWQKTYMKGVGELFIDDVEFDDSTETFQCQVSATIADPSTGEAIGAVTFGINIEVL